MKKQATMATLTLALAAACRSAAGNEGPARESGGDTLRFFVGSVRECTDEYAQRGYCKKTPLTRCISIDSAYEEDLVCKVVAKATLHSESNFRRLHTAVSVFDVPKAARQQVMCFDYGFLESPNWEFERFDKFNGQCQKRMAARSVTWTCDPEKTGCTFFEYDQATCMPGWPCMQIRIDARNLHATRCTVDLAAKNICTLEDPSLFACVSVSNKGPSGLRCDLRFNVERAADGQTTFRLLRNQLFHAGAQDQVCFRLEGLAEPGTVERVPVNAVCRQKDFAGDLSRICDLGKDKCAEESKVITYVR